MNYNKQEHLFIIRKRNACDDAEFLKDLNNRIEELKKSKLETTVSIVIYGEESEFLVERVNVKDIARPYEFNDFFTESYHFAYYDAFCGSLGLIGEKLENLPEEERPCIVFVHTEFEFIDTCSKENTEQDYNWQIAVQRDVYNWVFQKI